MVTIEDVRKVAVGLPRSEEALVWDRVKVPSRADRLPGVLA